MSEPLASEGTLHLYRPDDLEEVRLHESSGPRGHMIPRHRHQETLFSQVLEGEVHFVDGDSRQVLRAGPGDLVVLPADSVVSGECGGGYAWRMRTLWVREHALPPARVRPVTVLKANRNPLATHFTDTFEALVAPGNVGAKRLLLGRWLERVARHGLLEGRELSIPIAAESLRLLEVVREHIDGRLDRTPTLRELGQLAGWHPHHLQRLFRQRYGVTPSQYHAHRRLGAAFILLSQGIPAAEVALRLGFADQSHFIRVFRRYAGVTPGAVSTRSFYTETVVTG